MNGVLRLLSSTTTPPQPIPTKLPNPDSTPPLFLKKDKQKSPSPDPSHSRTLSNFSAPSPPSTKSQHLLNNSPSSSSSLNHRISRKSVNLSESGWKRNSGTLNTRDELLMSLMASEAIIDSRGFDILSAEEVEDLKKVTLHYIYVLN